jgi:Yip1 domain
VGVAAVTWAPVRVLRNVAAQRDVLAGLVVTAVYAALSLAAAAASILGGVTRAQFAGQPAAPPGLPPDALESLVRVTEVAMLVLSVLTPFVWWVAISLVMQLVTRFFNGEGPLSAMLAVVGVAGAPLALGALFQAVGTGLQAALGVESTAGTIAGLVGGLVALATLVWYVVLVVIGAAFARGIGYGESAGSCAVSCAGCFALIIVVAVVLLGIGVLIGTTAPQ